MSVVKVSFEGGKDRTYSTTLSSNLVAEWAKDPEVVARAVTASGEDLSVDWVRAHLASKASNEFVDLSLKGTAPPERLARVLEALISSLRERASQSVQETISRALTDIETQKEALLAKKDAWTKELQEIKARALSQRDSLLSQIEKLAQTQLEPDAFVQSPRGYRLQKELDLLYARLAEVETFLDQIDRLGVGALPGVAEEYNDLLGELSDLEVWKAILLELEKAPPSPLILVRGASVPSAPVGPNRKMNVAVAGVLGLFVGVLGAFMWNYLREGGDNGRS